MEEKNTVQSDILTHIQMQYKRAILIINLLKKIADELKKRDKKKPYITYEILKEL